MLIISFDIFCKNSYGKFTQEEPKPWEFRSKPSWQRLIIMLGGVTVNFILAAVIYIFMAFVYGSADIDAKSVVGGLESQANFKIF